MGEKMQTIMIYRYTVADMDVRFWGFYTEAGMGEGFTL
jgi:hypothetical protein